MLLIKPFYPVLSVFSSLGIPAPTELQVELPGKLGLTAMKFARDHMLGRGESTGNNRGPDIDLWRRHDGTGGPAGGSGAWCGVSASYALVQSALQLRVVLPFETSRGAKRLFKNACKAGARVTKPQPGDLFCLQRGQGPDQHWMGHIGFVEWAVGEEYGTLEGNVGAPMAKFKRGKRKLSDPKLIGFARV